MTLLVDVDEQAQRVVVATELLTAAERGDRRPSGFDWLDHLLDTVQRPLVRLQGWIGHAGQVDVIRGWCDERICCLALVRQEPGRTKVADLMVMEPERVPAELSRLFNLRPHPRVVLPEVLLHDPGTSWQPFLTAPALSDLLGDANVVPWLDLFQDPRCLRWKLDVQWTGPDGEDATVLDVTDSGPLGLAVVHSAPTPEGGTLLALTEVDSTELWVQMCDLLPAADECLRQPFPGR